MFFSLSPTYWLSNSGPFTDIKLTDDSVAMALARRVLPLPGGPKISNPERFFKFAKL